MRITDPMSNFKGSAQRASRAARPLFARANYYGAHTASVENKPLISQTKKEEGGELVGREEGEKKRRYGRRGRTISVTHTRSHTRIPRLGY